MSKDFESTLTGMINQVARAAQAPGSSVARTRGRQRATRQRLMVSSLSLAVAIAGAAVGVTVATGGTHGQNPAPPAASPSSSASASASAGSSAKPSASTSASPSAAAGVPSLALHVPDAFAAGTMNDFEFTVDNPGAARSVTVTVTLTAPNIHPDFNAGGYAPTPLSVLERQDPANGSWSAVPMLVTSTQPDATDTGTYQLALSPQTHTTQHLRVNPVTGQNGTKLRVTLTGSDINTLTQSASVPSRQPTVTTAGPASAPRGSTPTFTFTVTNTTPGTYDTIRLYLLAYGTTAACDVTPFGTAEWSDGAATQQATFTGAQGWDMITTISLAPGQSRQIRVQLPVPSSVPSCLHGGDVALLAGTGDHTVTGTTASDPPSFAARGDAAFAIS